MLNSEARYLASKPLSDKVVEVKCETCGITFRRYRQHAEASKHQFCSNECTTVFRKQNMKKLNAELNPVRMTPEMREAVRNGHINLRTGDEHCYEKYYGKHLHRILAEKKLGRKLKPGEVVHHIDSNCRNNSLDNLQVLPSQAEHAKLHKNADRKRFT